MFKVLKERREKIRVFLQFLVFYLLTFGVMLNRHYSTDSFRYINNVTGHYRGHLATGRVGAYFAAFIFKNINIIECQSYFTALLIMILSMCAAMIYNHYQSSILEEETCSKMLIKMAIAVMFGNVYLTDFFHFPEAIPPMALSVLFMAISILQVERAMSLKKTLLMLACMIISLNCYQVTLGFFIFFALINVYIIYKGNLTATALWDSIKIIICGGIAGISNVILLKSFQSIGMIDVNERTGNIGVSGLLANAEQIVQGVFQAFRDPWGFLPKNALFIIVVVLYALLIVALWRKKASWRSCLYIILLIVACRATVYIPHLLASTVWMAPRSIVSYWSIVGIPCMLLAVLADRRNIKNAALISMGVFSVISVLSIQKISLSIVSCNRLDEEISYMIQNKIQIYEEESGQDIETILFRNDSSPVYSYRSVGFSSYELGQRSYTIPWQCVTMINYFNGEDYAYDVMDDETFSKHFDKQNWDCLNLEEQLVFDGNTAYYVVY